MTKKIDFFALFYGIGAAILLTGILFKTLNWQYASELFLLGISTEIAVFLISGLQPREKTSQYQWERVFPGLNNEKHEDFRELEADIEQGVEELQMAQKTILKRYNHILDRLDLLQKSSSDLHYSFTDLYSRNEDLINSYSRLSQLSVEKTLETTDVTTSILNLTTGKLADLMELLSKANSRLAKEDEPYRELLELLDDFKVNKFSKHQFPHKP